MRMITVSRAIPAVICATALLALSACGGGKGLHNFSSGAGPDEFLVQPVPPLELPDSLSILPAPTPNGTNITDVDPTANAIAVLGGRASARNAGGIPARDAALVNQAGRHGVTPNIRAELAQADERFRKRRGAVSRLFGRNTYFKAYASMALDAYTELTRFRNAGVQTPSAPPQ